MYKHCQDRRECKFLKRERERDQLTQKCVPLTFHEEVRKNIPLTCISSPSFIRSWKNDDFRQLFHQKIKKWDACTSLLLVEKCQEALDGCEWQTCNYVKGNKNFWCEGGRQESAKKVPRISAVEQPREDVLISSNATKEPQKTTINQKIDELRKLKISDLVQLLNDLWPST